MGNKVLTMLLIMCTCGIMGQDIKNEKPKTFKNSIKIRPLNFFVNELIFDYERVIGPKSSLNITIGQGYQKDRLLVGGTIENYTSFLEVDYRRYFSKDKIAPRGWFVGVGIFGLYELDRFKNIGGTVEPNFDRDYFSTGISVDAGYQWVFNNGITLGLSGGADLRIPVDHSINSSSTRPNLNFSVGYSW